MFNDSDAAHREAGVPMTGVTWTDEEFENDDLNGIIFSECVFERIRLTATSLWQTVFVNCRFDDCELVDCRVFRTQFVECSGTGLRIVGGELAEVAISKSRFRTLNVEQSGRQVVIAESEIGRAAFNAEGCTQQALTISGTSFESVAAENVEWSGCAAIGADLSVWALSGARLRNCSFIKSTGDGLDLSSVRFERCNLYRASFREARIREAPGSIFAECDCDGADFEGAELDGALFAKTRAVKARFAGARLGNAMFPDATLTEADFSGASARLSAWPGADLTGASLERLDAYRSTFRNAVLEDASVEAASFVEADLHGVEEPLAGADLRGSRGTVPWRAEREKEARSAPKSKP